MMSHGPRSCYARGTWIGIKNNPKYGLLDTKNNLAVSAPFAQIKFGYFISKRGEINEMFGFF